jgi:hypothetical protein
MVEELLPDSFLRRMFGSFFDMLRENGEHVGGALFNEANSLKAVLRVALGWEYDLQVGCTLTRFVLLCPTPQV